MGFNYRPLEITLCLIAGTAALGAFFRIRKGHTMSWPLLFWLFLLWFQFQWEVFEPLYVVIAMAATLLVRYEFHGGGFTKFFILLELTAFGWCGYTALAEAFGFR
jgi:hypothetical protein